MATTDNLDIELLSTNPLQLDPIVNEAFTTIDACLAGTSTYNFTADANYTLTDEYFTAYLTLTDGSTNLTTGRDVIYPAAFPIQIVKNSTAQTLTLKVSGQTGITLSAGSTTMIYADGTDVLTYGTSGGFSNPMTTAGDLILGGSGGSAGRLAIGTNGYVLTSDGTTASWAAASAGFSNPMTTAGDLILGGSGGAAGRLAIGTNGYVLTSNGTTAAWSASPGARQTVTAETSSSGVVDFDWSNGDYHTLTLSENVSSITFSNLPGAGNGATMMIRITQDSTARTVTWPSSFRWEGGVAGAVSTGSGAVDVLAITTFDNGTTWVATLVNGVSAP